MARVVIFGRSGKMGSLIEAQCIKNGHDVVGGISQYENVFQKDIQFDLIIDFSLPIVLEKHYEDVFRSKKPLISGVTGLNETQKNQMLLLSKNQPVLHSTNYSLGIYYLKNALTSISKSIPKNARIEIIEKHHKNKIDIPSGTAITLANQIIKTGNKDNYTIEPSNHNENSIHIHSIRGGSIVGEHSIQIILDNEIIELRHEALNRSIFAEGAVFCAEKIIHMKAGFYRINEIIEG